MSHKLKIRSKLSKIDLKFINQANEIKNLSLAEDKKVGAIIANHKNGEILAIGYNKMFDDLGFQNCEDETGQSLPYVIHAEEIAVILGVGEIGKIALPGGKFGLHGQYPC
jgi:deoxycytidylate deaminase